MRITIKICHKNILLLQTALAKIRQLNSKYVQSSVQAHMKSVLFTFFKTIVTVLILFPSLDLSDLFIMKYQQHYRIRGINMLVYSV